MMKRRSIRLESIPESKRPYYGPSTIDSELFQEKKSAPKKQKCNPIVTTSAIVDQGTSKPQLEQKPERSYCNGTELKNGRQRSSTQHLEKKTESRYNDRDAQLSIVEKGDHARVKETLKVYNSHFLRLAQEGAAGITQPVKRQKELNGQKKKCEVNRFDLGAISEEGAAGITQPVKRQKELTGQKKKRKVNRFDLGAISEMVRSNEILFPQKRIGHLPGIDVGFRFYSRCEMIAVGLHSLAMPGIDYMGKNYAKKGKEYKAYTFPLAVAIVVSGHYEDNVDNREELWYTGEGGNDLRASNKQIKDQELIKGNLALKNNFDQSQPVRVIRKNNSGDKDCPKFYIYDGLYKVVECKSGKGKTGFKVYQFRLEREPGQPDLTSDQVRFTREHKPYTKREVPGLLSVDIAAGQEGIDVRVINTVDYPAAPTGFTYTSSLTVPEGIELPANAEGCKCKGTCTDTNSCACAILNGNKFPYVRVRGGSLIKATDILYECGPNCGCGPDCINRISQRKLKYKLEIYKTQEKGWAVRSRDFISMGTPVCEYLGVLKKTSELNSVNSNDYIFEIDCQHTMKGIGGRQRRSTSVTNSGQLDNVDDEEPDPDYLVDAGSVGNVARFINHSCQPNLFVQCVLSSHHDPRLARIVLFASENISPFEELTYDYGYALDSVVDSDGNVKKLECHCGAVDCRKRLY